MGKLYTCWALLVILCTSGIMATSSLDKREIALNYMPKIDRERMECNFGQFYSYESETCHSCDRTCENRTDLLTSCGFECQSYFRISNLTAELQEQESQKQREIADLQREKEELEGRNIGFLIAVIVLAVSLVGCAITIFILCTRPMKRTTAYSNPSHPTGDADAVGQSQTTLA